MPERKKNGRNFDYPQPLRGRMAKNALRDMAKHASELDKALVDADTLPAWVDYYIATSSDRMNTVGNYMQGEIQRFEASTPQQQSQAYGGDALSAEVMLTEYGYAGLFEDALDRIGSWASPDERKQDSVKKVLRAAAYVYLASMPVAAGVAYYKTKSIPQTIGASLVSIPYLLIAAGQVLLK